jgi:hypothetical protein
MGTTKRMRSKERGDVDHDRDVHVKKMYGRGVPNDLPLRSPAVQAPSTHRWNKY